MLRVFTSISPRVQPKFVIATATVQSKFLPQRVDIDKVPRALSHTPNGGLQVEGDGLIWVLDIHDARTIWFDLC